MTLTVGSLFSGIGGIDLGLEWAGMTVRWQSEVNPYCCRVLAKHWPDVPNLGDVTTIDWSTVERVDLICGGYPCQPFSQAGRRRGADDPRHLWPHFATALRELRPRWALLENVPGHLSKGFDQVLADLAEVGYDADWDSIPAAAVGAPHRRYRLFVVAHTDSPHWLVDADAGDGRAVPAQGQLGQLHRGDGQRDVADTGGPRRRQDGRGAPGDEATHEGWPTQDDHLVERDGAGRRAGSVADAESEPLGAGLREGGARQEAGGFDIAQPGDSGGESRDVPDTIGVGDGHVDDGTAADVGAGAGADEGGRDTVHESEREWWPAEPAVGRVAYGVPCRVDRLRGLGNAVVPQVAEWLGRVILAADG